MRLRFFVSGRLPAFLCISALICLLICDSCGVHLVVSGDAVKIVASDDGYDDSILDARFSDRVASLISPNDDITDETAPAFEGLSLSDIVVARPVRTDAFLRNVYYVFLAALAP